jgi:hypothetical protein
VERRIFAMNVAGDDKILLHMDTDNAELLVSDDIQCILQLLGRTEAVRRSCSREKEITSCTYVHYSMISGYSNARLDVMFWNVSSVRRKRRLLVPVKAAFSLATH